MEKKRNDFTIFDHEIQNNNNEEFRSGIQMKAFSVPFCCYFGYSRTHVINRIDTIL